MRTDRLRLLDAIEQIELISSFSIRGREAFFQDLMLQSAILHRLALLGEACREYLRSRAIRIQKFLGPRSLHFGTSLCMNIPGLMLCWCG